MCCRVGVALVTTPQLNPAPKGENMSAKKDQTKKVDATKAKKASETETAGETAEMAPSKAAKAPKTTAEPKPKKMSALDAAAKVLGEQGKPMNCQELVQEMGRKNYWTSPNGATPNATLYAAMLREI